MFVPVIFNPAFAYVKSTENIEKKVVPVMLLPRMFCDSR
jgi:hypothetical protein